MRIVTPPDSNSFGSAFKIFLAGTIEMGNSTDWQSSVIEKLQEKYKLSPMIIFNPRRNDWNSSWQQTETDFHFNQQVNWELTNIELSDVVLLHFEGDSRSPISLMELGFLGDKGKAIVSCPKSFWRRGNVEIFCSRHRIPLFASLDEAMGSLFTRINSELRNWR